MLILPVFSQNPTTGMVLGVGATGTHRSKDPTTQASTFNGAIAYSAESQLLTGFAYSLFPAGNRWNLQGEWAYLDTSCGPLVHGMRNSSALRHALRCCCNKITRI
jgi:hypothetical protein